MSAWKKIKISSSFSPPHSNFCFLLHLCLVKWFPVTNCTNCQTQTLHFCSFLSPCLPCRLPGLLCRGGSACPAPQMDTELPTMLHHHPPAPQDSPLGSQNTPGYSLKLHFILQAREGKTFHFVPLRAVAVYLGSFPIFL